MHHISCCESQSQQLLNQGMDQRAAARVSESRQKHEQRWRSGQRLADMMTQQQPAAGLGEARHRACAVYTIDIELEIKKHERG
jgi:hypothetical protein